MRIAVFYPGGVGAWSVCKGICVVLERMGHTVLDCYTYPRIEKLHEQDVIIVSGPEYLWRSIRAEYPQWDELKAKKIGWLQETVEREDYTTNSIAINGRLPVAELKKLTPKLCTQAHQDVIYDLIFVPCGVDTKMFYPRDGNKDAGPIYTGSLYGKRRKFLSDYPEVKSHFAYREYSTVEEYAQALSQATVVLNLPSLSLMPTARLFEVLASGVALISPSMNDESNAQLFLHGKHILYYSKDPMPAIRSAHREVLRKFIAKTGYEEVLAKHTLEHRLIRLVYM